MNTDAFFSALLIIAGFVFFSAQENYNTLIYKGNRQFDQKNYESASSKYAEAAKVNGQDFTAHYNLGNALYKSAKFEEAKAEFQKAEKSSKTTSDKVAALYNLGNAHVKTNQPEKAAEVYKKALKQDPYNEAIRKNYQIAMLKDKEQQEQQKQQNQKSNSGNDGNNKDKNEQDKGKDKTNTPKNEQGNGQQNTGEGEQGKQPEQKNNNNEDNLPKDLEDAILNRVENKERETAKRILNKNSYSMPQSNDKDW